MGDEQEEGETHMHVKGVEEEAWLRVIEVATLSCLPMAIKAAINLNVMQILSSQSDGSHLSAPQIVARMHSLATAKPAPPSSLLDRILRLLASHGILSSSLQTSPHHKLLTHTNPNHNTTIHASTSLESLQNPPLPTTESFVLNNSNHDITIDGSTSLECLKENPPPLPTRAYGLNSISKYFVAHDESSASLSPFILMHQDNVFIQSLLHIDEALLDGGEPFTKAHGKSCFLYNQEDARFDKIFNLAMHNHSRLLVSTLVDTYNGFDGLQSLVDVGGGLGVTLGIITSKHPHIHGINFDQPHIIAKAPQYPGVEHVAGDMFVSIPKANAVFMKWILHDWDDDNCLKILQNCYQALPSKGKVIVVDAVLPVKVDSKLKSRVGYHLDLLMFCYNVGGRERTLHELKALALCVGFSHLQVICEVQELTIVEIYKS